MENNMKLLITGGAGFIGSAFVRRALKDHYRVSVIDMLTYAGDRERLSGLEGSMDFHCLDITDMEALAGLFSSSPPDAVVHFAAETHVDRSILYPEGFVKTNVTGTTNLLALAHRHGVKKFVHLSTDEVYGDLPPGGDSKFTEESDIRPNSPYSASKASGDMFVRAYFRTFNLPVVTLRPSNNYGPMQYPEKLIPLVIARIMNGERIPVYGKGENIRTWLYVDDCTEAVLSVLERGRPGEVYNAGSDEEVKNIDMVMHLLSHLSGDPSLIEFVADRPGHDFRYAVDSEKLRNELGWRPVVGFQEGIAKTVSWYREHREWLMEKKSMVEGFVKELHREFQRRRDMQGSTQEHS
jgi:dTDP-glucose 4,6-dehydratase